MIDRETLTACELACMAACGHCSTTGHPDGDRQPRVGGITPAAGKALPRLMCVKAFDRCGVMALLQDCYLDAAAAAELAGDPTGALAVCEHLLDAYQTGTGAVPPLVLRGDEPEGVGVDGFPTVTVAKVPDKPLSRAELAAASDALVAATRANGGAEPAALIIGEDTAQ